MRAREAATSAPAPAARPGDAIVQLCTFRIGGEDYAIDVMRVREIIRPLPITPVPRAPSFVEGVMRLRGEVIPVLDVRKRLGVAAAAPTRKTRLLVVNVAGRRFGLVVDEVREVLRLPRGEIRAAPALGAPGIARFFLGVCGGDDAGDGPASGRRSTPMRLLLNVKALLDPAVAGEAEEARAQAEASRRA